MAEAPSPAAASSRVWVMIAAAGLLLGLAGDLFFYSTPAGINVFLFVLLFLFSGAVLIELADRRLSPLNGLLMIPVLFFAAMIAGVCADYLRFWDLLWVGVSLCLVVRFVTVPQFLGGSVSRAGVALLDTAVFGWLETIQVGRRVWEWAAHAYRLKREHVAAGRAVLRGCALAFPVVIVFVVLFSSADMVFADLIEAVIDWLIIDSLGDLIGHLLVIVFFGWAAAGLLKIMLIGPGMPLAAPADTPSPLLPAHLRVQLGKSIPAESASPMPAPSLLPSLGMIEGGIVLASVDALFLVFVAIQARYLFGGRSNINVEGYTYSEYARRGFFELLTVAVFTLALVFVLDRTTKRSDKHEPLFRALAVGLIAMTLVILASAFQRMQLYEDAYGFTRLRVISHVFMVWLALLLIVLAADLFRAFPNLLWIGGMGVAFGFFATLNLLNVDAFIAARNVDRFERTGKIDVYYLTTLTDDAVPATARLLDAEGLSAEEYQQVRRHLQDRLVELDHRRDDRRWLGYHYGEDRAWRVLDHHRDVLRYR